MVVSKKGTGGKLEPKEVGAMVVKARGGIGGVELEWWCWSKGEREAEHKRSGARVSSEQID